MVNQRCTILISPLYSIDTDTPHCPVCSHCDDSDQLSHVQYGSCWCPESQPGYPELMRLTSFRSECLSGIWARTGLCVEIPLSALTYFWQFTNRPVQYGHMSVSFYWVGSWVNVFILHRGGIIDGFTCVQTYNQLVQCRFCSWRHCSVSASALSSVHALWRRLVMTRCYSFHSTGTSNDGQSNYLPGGP